MAGDKNSTNDTKANANASGGAAPEQSFQFAQKPPELSGWEGFKQFLWNSNTSEFMGRTGMSWLKITAFYVLYYAFLAGYFIAMLVIFYQTLDHKKPRWQNSNGIIGDNPGLGFRPGPPDSNIESTLVAFKHGVIENDGPGTWDGFVDRLDKWLDGYKKPEDRRASLTTTTEAPIDPNDYVDDEVDIIDCAFDRRPGPKQICKVDPDKLLTGPCTKSNNYGFEEGKPCMLLKLNKIYGWNPKPYENSTYLAKAEDVPKELVAYVEARESDPDPNVRAETGNAVYVWCEGENPADIENIGPIDYYPSAAIPNYYFPYYDQNGYLSPVVFAHLSNPTHGVLISISCKAWAKNIEHNVLERRGTTHFEILID